MSSWTMGIGSSVLEMVETGPWGDHPRRCSVKVHTGDHVYHAGWVEPNRGFVPYFGASPDISCLCHSDEFQSAVRHIRAILIARDVHDL